MSEMNHYVIVGATSSIAEHCARLWAKDGARFTLIGRSAERLNLIAMDLRVRSPASAVVVRVMDFTRTDSISAVVDEVSANRVDVVLIAHGVLPDQAACKTSLDLCREALEVNGVSAVLCAEAFAGVLSRQGQGSLAVIGSVAGDRGRKSNYVYGAAKGLVERYVEGLQHRFSGSGVSITLIKPGPTCTPMTAHLQGSGAALASVEGVACGIVRSIFKRQAVVYLPWKWRYIMFVITRLPGFVFNKLDI